MSLRFRVDLKVDLLAERIRGGNIGRGITPGYLNDFGPMQWLLSPKGIWFGRLRFKIWSVVDKSDLCLDS